MKSSLKTDARICIYRRGILRKLVAASALVPFTGLWTSRVAVAAEKLSEDDPTAISLGYKHNAAQATHEAYSSGRDCAGCLFFQGGDQPEGSCPVFRGKLVNAKGWCASWRQRG
jgi:hypothetical protein